MYTFEMGALNSTVTANGDTAHVKFSGTIDDDSGFISTTFSEFRTITLDLKDIDRVTSKGVRAWVLWIARLDNTKVFNVCNVAKVFVTQANLIPGLIPHWMKVKSVELPYYCASCGSAFGRILELQDSQAPSEVEASIKCDRCSENAEFDAIADRYFQFLKPQVTRK